MLQADDFEGGTVRGDVLCVSLLEPLDDPVAAVGFHLEKMRRHERNQRQRRKERTCQGDGDRDPHLFEPDGHLGAGADDRDGPWEPAGDDWQRARRLERVTGIAAAEADRARLPVERQERYRPFSFLDEDMAAALASAWIVVGRAGSSTLAECAAAGVPLVVVPYPHAAAHQAANAAIDHMHDWALGTPAGEYTSMAVPSDGSYGIDEGLIFSFPLTSDGQGNYDIVKRSTYISPASSFYFNNPLL